MASAKCIRNTIALIKTVYNGFFKDVDMRTLASAWEMTLTDYSDTEVEKGLKHCMLTCRKYPPTPADIADAISTLYTACMPSISSLWTIYTDTLDKAYECYQEYGYTAMTDGGITQGQAARLRVNELYDNLPATVKAYVGSASALIANARDYNFADYTGMSVEKTRFERVMRERTSDIHGDTLLTAGEQECLPGGESA